MTYTVKEIFYTLQGEGAHAGRPAVFCRFAGCNLWTGREQDRATALCRFCDTEFRGGDKYRLAAVLARVLRDQWPGGGGKPYVVLTGGEPTLQVTPKLTSELRCLGFEVAMETNGTNAVEPGLVDWLTVSPKAGAPLNQRTGHEIKLVYPQAVEPSEYEGLPFQRFYLQPMDGIEVEANTQAAIRYCLDHPQWRLSLQTHKAVGLR